MSFSRNRSTVGSVFTFRYYHLKKERICKKHKFDFIGSEMSTLQRFPFYCTGPSKQALCKQHESGCNNQIRQSVVVA